MEGQNSSLGNNAALNEEIDSNKSFVKKVKSHVSGLLSTSFGKWFSGDNNVETKIRHRVYDEDDDSYETQPPSKRVKMPTPETKPFLNSLSNNFSPISSRNEPKLRPNIFEPVAGPSGLQHHSNMSSTAALFNGDKESESGESEMSPLPRVRNSTESLINLNTPTSTHNRSLFNDRTLTPNLNTSLSSKRPSFNASTFGSPNFVDRTLSTKQILSSPFYNGRTIYGGASAYSSRQKNVPERLKSQIQVKPVSSAVGNDVSLSRTARRILNALEEFNPIVDAKKIPYPKQKVRSEGILSKYTGANPYLSRDRKIPFALNKELQVPTVPDLLKMKLKERLQDSTVAVRQIATTSKSVLNRDDYRIRSKEDDVPKHTNKVKNKLTATRQKIDNQQVEEVKLPEISLPITTLPKFDFSLPPPPSSGKQPLITVACGESSKTVNPAPAIKKAETVDVKDGETQFEFSNPLILADNLKSIIAINDFKFSDPIFKQKDKNVSDIGLNFKTAAPETVMLKRKNPDLPVPFKLSKESIEEVFNKTATDSLDKFKPAANLWECSVCLIRNAPEKLKCVACEAVKSDCSVIKSNTLTKPAPSLAEQFKPPSSTWECPTCLIRNKDETEKCVACETAKPGLKSAIPSQSGFGDLFKKKESEWECTVCMIRNKDDKMSCEACETAKPGTKGSDNVKAPEKVEVTTFNFGIFPTTASVTTGNESIQTSAISLPNTTTTATVPSTIPAFTFGIPATQTVTAKETIVKPVLPAPKVDNPMGIDKPVQEPTKPPSSSAFMFSVPTKPNVVNTTVSNPTQQEISNKPVILSTSPSAFKFGKNTTTTTSSLKRSAADSESAVIESKKLSSPITFQPPAVNSLPTSTPLHSVQSPDKPLFNIGKTAVSQTPTTSPSFVFTPTPSKSQPTVTTTTNLFTFGAKTTSQSLFGNTVTTTQASVFKFSSTEKPTSNQPTFGIGEEQPSLPLFSSPTTNSMFGATKSAFEVPAATQPFGTVVSTAFAPEPKPPMAFAPEPKPPMAFANNSKSQSVFGIEPKSSLFGTEPKSTPSFGTEQSAPTFGTEQKTAPVFGADQKATPVFGVEQKTAPVFGAEQKTVSVFGGEQKTSAVFGGEQKTAPVFGTELKAAPFEQKAPLFGNEQKPSQSMFGTDQKPLPAFGSPNAKPFSFGAPGPSNETSSKPSLFSFGAKSSEPSKPFSFGTTPAPSQPAGGFNFSSTTTPAFNFNAPKVETASPFQTAPNANNMFNPLPVQAQPLQNGGFNFGTSTNANNTNKTGFNFGATNQFAPPSQAPASTVPTPRGFWGTGNNPNENPAPAAGGFNFGQASQAPAFNANIKPNFNFTAGNVIPGFSATAESSPVTQRRRLKAVRRNPR